MNDKTWFILLLCAWGVVGKNIWDINQKFPAISFDTSPWQQIEFTTSNEKNQMLFLQVEGTHDPLLGSYVGPKKSWGIYFSRNTPCSSANYSQKFEYEKTTRNVQAFLPVEGNKHHYLCFFAPEMLLNISAEFFGISKLSVGTTSRFHFESSNQFSFFQVNLLNSPVTVTIESSNTMVIWANYGYFPSIDNFAYHFETKNISGSPHFSFMSVPPELEFQTSFYLPLSSNGVAWLVISYPEDTQVVIRTELSSKSWMIFVTFQWIELWFFILLLPTACLNAPDDRHVLIYKSKKRHVTALITALFIVTPFLIFGTALLNSQRQRIGIFFILVGTVNFLLTFFYTGPDMVMFHRDTQQVSFYKYYCTLYPVKKTWPFEKVQVKLRSYTYRYGRFADEEEDDIELTVRTPNGVCAIPFDSATDCIREKRNICRFMTKLPRRLAAVTINANN